MTEQMEAMLEGKQKEEITGKIKQRPFSDSTVTSTTGLLADDLRKTALWRNITDTRSISLAVDESTDITDKAQFKVIFVVTSYKATQYLYILVVVMQSALSAVRQHL